MKNVSIKNKKRTKKIGIILTYNCSQLLVKTVRNIPKGCLDQIIISDDGSTDNVRQLANKLNIPFYSHAHRGYGGNIKFGLKKAMELGADYMVEIHGDGQYDYSVIPTALKKIESGYDFLFGSRFTTLKQAIIDDHMPIERYLSNIGLTMIAKLVLQLPLTEVHSGFRVYSSNLLKTIGFKNTSNDHIYSFENLAQAKYCNLPITEIPIHCNFAQQHTSMSIIRSVIYSLDMFRVMGEYLLAKIGFNRKLFQYSRGRNRNNKFTSILSKP